MGGYLDLHPNLGYGSWKKNEKKMKKIEPGYRYKLDVKIGLAKVSCSEIMALNNMMLFFNFLRFAISLSGF